MGLFTVVHRFFLLHFPGFGPDKALNLRIAQLIARLKKTKHGVYDPVSNTLNPGYTAAILALEELAGDLQPVCRRVLGSDQPSQAAAGRALLWYRLTKQGLPPEAFAFPGEPQPAPGQTPADWDRTFESKLAVLRTLPLTNAARGWATVRQIADLAGFQFAGLKTDGMVRRPGARVPAEKVTTGLLDLLFVLPDQADRVAADVLTDLGQAAQVDTAVSAALVLRLGALVAASFDPSYWADVVRCALEEPDLEVRTAPPPDDLLESLRRELTEDWQAKRQDYRRAQADRAFQARLEALFAPAAVLTVGGYDGPAATLLAAHGLPEYGLVRPVRALKNFFVLQYQPRLRQAIGSFFLEMEFTDNRFKKELVAAVDALDRCQADTAQFEEDADVFLKTRIHPLVEVMENGLLGRSAKEALRAAVDGINVQADEVVQDAFSALRRLAAGLTKVRADWGSRTPEVLANAAYLANHAPHFLNDLDETLARTGALADLLGQVSVDMETAQEILTEEAPDPSP